MLVVNAVYSICLALHFCTDDRESTLLPPSLFEQVERLVRQTNESGNLIAYVLLSSVMMTINISNGACFF